MIISLKATAPDPDYVDSRPLSAMTKKLPKVPAYMKCDALVFPAHTKYKRKGWTIADSMRRCIPTSKGTVAYVKAYEDLNQLVRTV